jgi:vesicle-fusing ATPase
LSFIVKTIQLANLNIVKRGLVPTISTLQARGILTKKTIIIFYKDTKSPIKLKGLVKRPATNSIIIPDFKFEDIGIGRLDIEFSTIFRRAFASRIFLPGLIEKLGI